MDCSLRGSSVHGIFQARVLEWGAIAFPNTLKLCWKPLEVCTPQSKQWLVAQNLPRGLSDPGIRPRDRTWVSCITGRFFTVWATREAHKHVNAQHKYEVINYDKCKARKWTWRISVGASKIKRGWKLWGLPPRPWVLSTQELGKGRDFWWSSG